MHISNNFISKKFVKSFQPFACNWRAQMTGMKRFCYIRAAIVKNNLLTLLMLFNSAHLVQKICIDNLCQLFIGELNIDKSRFCNFKCKIFALFNIFNNLACKVKWICIASFAKCKSVITLKITKLWHIRKRDRERLVYSSLFSPII